MGGQQGTRASAGSGCPELMSGAQKADRAADQEALPPTSGAIPVSQQGCALNLYLLNKFLP